jgi:hypothetical protein
MPVNQIFMRYGDILVNETQYCVFFRKVPISHYTHLLKSIYSQL